MNKVIVLDFDGVLSLPEEAFSLIYTRSHGYDIAPFVEFFKNEWKDIVVGKIDLKEHIKTNRDFWKWHKSPEELLLYWLSQRMLRTIPF